MTVAIISEAGHPIGILQAVLRENARSNGGFRRIGLTAVLITASIGLLVGTSCSPRQNAGKPNMQTITVDDNTLLALILARPRSDEYVMPGDWFTYLDVNPNDPNEVREFFQELRRSGAMDYPPYTVVAPQTRFCSFDPIDPNNLIGVKRTKKYIREELKIKGYDASELIDRLFERNKKSVRLSLESSRADGYVVDYEGEYAKYFKEGGGGLKRWYRDHPTAIGWTGISLPAYDPETGIILVYKDTAIGHYGGGGLYIYRYESGELKEIASVALWNT